jgi:hypothetical protein
VVFGEPKLTSRPDQINDPVGFFVSGWPVEFASGGLSPMGNEKYQILLR